MNEKHNEKKNEEKWGEKNDIDIKFHPKFRGNSEGYKLNKKNIVEIFKKS